MSMQSPAKQIAGNRFFLIAILIAPAAPDRIICNQFSRHREQRRRDRSAVHLGGDCTPQFCFKFRGVEDSSKAF